jgi:hypothetical protein
MRRTNYHCDACDNAPAVHRHAGPPEGTFCCACVHCDTPIECRDDADWGALTNAARKRLSPDERDHS